MGDRGTGREKGTGKREREQRARLGGWRRGRKMKTKEGKSKGE